MSEWKVKRFWTEATVEPQAEGFAVLLDGRPVKTPAKAQLILPTEGLAREVAAEWQAVDENIDPLTMPFTRSANAAIDKVSLQHGEVADMIAAYGDSDLTCYRADTPEGLVKRQAEAWDPVLDWARVEQGISLTPVQGVMHSPQEAKSLDRMAALTHQLDPFALTAFHDLVSLSGSFLLGLAVTEGLYPPEKVWQLSRIDETWQEEQWGEDEEATELAQTKKAAFLHAARFFELSKQAGKSSMGCIAGLT
ncbi:MAG: ATPase [Rhodobacterales bacterium]|nr:MAG: ATPase [Rhodobacterales bacterium]